ncbi:hypothetical protein N9A72_00040 [bacterium]|nr:hypothetical protein [bacterium]
MKTILTLLFLLFLPMTSLGSQKNFTLPEEGEERIVDYSKYGEFLNVGTTRYKYRITDREGLSGAVGIGIYPNTEAYRNPTYLKLKMQGRLKGNHWDFANGDDKASFYKWATTSEEPGIKLFFTAQILEKAGLIGRAIKSYYAILVHFPKSVGWTYWNTPWYVGQVAMDKINFLARTNPEIGIKLVDTRLKIKNQHDNDIKNDVIICNPGKLVERAVEEPASGRIEIEKSNIARIIGKGKIKLIRFINGHWQLQVDGKPYVVKGMAYSPNKVGLSPDDESLVVHKDWMLDDYDRNGKIDGPYDSWVDENKNNKRDPGEKTVGDFQLMKNMGVNTIRLYHHGFNKELLKDLYKNYGIMTIMGDYLGMYAIGSEADWYKGTDYTNKKHKKNMMKSVKEMVMKYKDEPYILMWVLGNENNYGQTGKKGKSGSGCNAKDQPEAYYKFVNEVAKWIKANDPNHPVCISNGDLLYLDIFAKNESWVDIFGCNSYRGPQGFGINFWEGIKEVCDKPALITEYGCPAYYKGKNLATGEREQAKYHRGNWEDIASNLAGSGVGNVIGGVIFEWVDEWWKAGPPPRFDPFSQEIVGDFPGPFPDGLMHEEWLGICSQGDGSKSPFLRQLRKAYYVYQELWRE